jgi:putative inorganic carbon (HCO3(-)) transporter
MRDLAITLIVVIGCIYTLKKPYVGILLWSWLSYMNPHRMAFGFAYNMPYAQITALVLFISTLFSREKRGIPINNVTITWLLFILYAGITTSFAFFPEQALIQFTKVLKIQLCVF